MNERPGADWKPTPAGILVPPDARGPMFPVRVVGFVLPDAQAPEKATR